MKHTLLVTVVTLCALFTFIDATDYRSKRSPEFFDVVNSPITYFQDNRTYNREVREHGLPPTSKAQIRRSLARLNIVYSQISDSQKTKGQSYIDECHKRSRYVFFTNGMKLGKMNNTNLCGTSNTSDFGDCDWLMYAESISLQAIIPIILGIIAFPFACIIVWSARMCCCGGNKPSKGLCCGSTSSWNVEKDGYTSSEVMLIVIILVAAAAVFLGLMSYGIVADNDLSNHVTDFILTMKNTSDHLKESLDTIESAIKDIDSGSKGFLSSDLNSFTGDINAYLDDFANFMDSTKSTVDKVNGYRHNFMFSTFIGPAILCILAVIGGLIGFPLLSFPLGIFGFAFVLVGAITFGVFFPLSTVMSDVCVIANESIYSDTPRSDFLLDYILSCSEDSPITSINKYAVEALNKTSEMICDVLVEACNTTLPCGYDADNKEIIYCPLMTNCPTVECNLTTADTWANMSVKDYYIGCFDKNTGDFVQNSTGGTCPYNASASTREVCPGGNVVPGICNGNTTDSYPLGTCMDECKSEVFKDTSRSIVKYYDQYKKLVDIIENEILPLFNCVTVKGLLMDLMDYLCFGTMSSLKPITISVCAMAVLMLVATITGIVSIKRFNKKNRMNDRKDDTEMYSSGGGGNNDGGEVDNVYEDRKKPKEEEDYNGGGEVDNAYEDRRECEMEVFPDN